MSPAIGVRRLEGADPAVPLPAYASAGAAGADIRANLPPDQRATGLSLAPMERLAVPTGLALEMPGGWEGQLRPRSGLALRAGLTLLNTPGTIDSDYRGEVRVLMINLGEGPATIDHGARIAQLVIAPAARARFAGVAALAGTARGYGGFGSTGLG